jgi:hypothetical protein|tara:strand:- start:436 stop:573 length:138 start_codon:yes stop_codon:yes gene_type:complete
MINQHKIILGIAVTYFVVVSLVALKMSRAGGDDEEEDIEEEKKVE